MQEALNNNPFAFLKKEFPPLGIDQATSPSRMTSKHPHRRLIVSGKAANPEHPTKQGLELKDGEQPYTGGQTLGIGVCAQLGEGVEPEEQYPLETLILAQKEVGFMQANMVEGRF